LVVAPRGYAFVPDAERLVGVFRGSDTIAIGKLDMAGRFSEAKRFRVDAPFAFRNMPDFHLLYGLPADDMIIPAYEYRLGRLTKGAINRNGIFVPDLAIVEIDFANYQPGPTSPIIWNLPGYLMRRDELDERRKWLAEHMAENPKAYGKEKARLDAAVEPKK
jgi:hypothetical protein